MSKLEGICAIGEFLVPTKNVDLKIRRKNSEKLTSDKDSEEGRKSPEGDKLIGEFTRLLELNEKALGQKAN
jgi:hypothetical protein